MKRVAFVATCLLVLSSCSTATDSGRQAVEKAELSILKDWYYEGVYPDCVREAVWLDQDVAEYRSQMGTEMEELLDQKAIELHRLSQQDREKVVTADRLECIRKARRGNAQLEKIQETIQEAIDRMQGKRHYLREKYRIREKHRMMETYRKLREKLLLR